MEGRNQVFQKLKPPCVALSQAALALNGPNGDVVAAVRGLEDLETMLSSIVSKPGTLDEKLADYVFFPLSQVLRASQRASVRCLELALRCLALLIEHGWRSKIQAQLAAQVLILCTMMAEKTPKGLGSAESTDELQRNALRCLHHLFEVAQASASVYELFVAESNIPQLGQTISTILTCITESASTEVQAAATMALRILMYNAASIDIKAGFLPGIVSALTKVLTPQTKHRRNHMVLVGALDVLCHLFESTLSDAVLSEVTSTLSIGISKSAKKTSKVIDQAWLQKAASQLKPAITHIMKLHTHERNDVKDALSRFCFTVLACHHSLQNCAGLCLETVITMVSDPSEPIAKSVLEAFLSNSPSSSSALQDVCYDWAQSLPNKMQSADDHAKVRHIRQLMTAYTVAVNNGIDMSMLERSLSDLLRDSSIVMLHSTNKNQSIHASVSQIQLIELNAFGQDQRSTEFGPLLVNDRDESDVMSTISCFARIISTVSTSIVFSEGVARGLRQSRGDALLASFWLLSESTRAALQSTVEISDFLDIDAVASDSHLLVLEDLYTFSLDILGQTSDELGDPRLQGLALRILALRAQTAGVDFRSELIDALYPVLHCLATPEDHLQQDSIVALNVLTTACNYSSVQDMIVENVDYLTNAVALKLNAFDVKPQAPQVLLMMVRLAGPSLLPYLEDTIDSIFAALEDFHGYPLLVELLFKVLSAVAEEGSKAPQLGLTEDTKQATKGLREEAWQPSDFGSLSAILKGWAEEEHSNQLRPQCDLDPHPKRPWKDIQQPQDVDGLLEEDDSEESVQDEQAVDIPDPPPPAPKTYKLLLKISELTQHYLPSASPSLRASLLVLVKTTIPAIARHENSFLPLINTLWPEVVSRLNDSEQYIVTAALDTIALLCEYAGDFMRARIRDLWPGLIELVSKTTGEIVHAASMNAREESSYAGLLIKTPLERALQRMRTAPAEYSDASTRSLWEAEVRALSAIVEHVPLLPQMFDDALELLEPVLDDSRVRSALERQNADAVWLALARKGSIQVPPLPVVSGDVPLQFAAVAG